ncbi:MAG: HD-GYP domain-containing protein [Planctomycetota bacterium]
MRRIAVDALPQGALLERPLYHESGHVLVPAGERLEPSIIEQLTRSGIRRVYDLGGDGLGDEVTHSSIPIGLLMAGEANPDEPPGEVQGFLRERQSERVERTRRELTLPEIHPERLIHDPKGELRPDSIKAVIERSAEGERPEGISARDSITAALPLPPRTDEEKLQARARRRALCWNLARIFDELSGNVPIEHAALLRLAHGITGFVLADRDLAVVLLRDGLGTDAARPSAERRTSAERPQPGPLDFELARHSVNVTTLALAMALELGHGLPQIVELACAALLHDVGMLRIPQELRRKPGELGEEERREMERHPLHALALLRRFDRLPLAVLSVAAHEHERPDGSGYPYGITGASPFAAIVAVADVYEALSSDRPHREALKPHAAMRQLIQIGSKGQLDTTALRALLRVVGLFPVGSTVGLNDGRRAKVARATDGGRPLLIVLPGEHAGASPVPELLDLTEHPDVRITDVDETSSEPLLAYL